MTGEKGKLYQYDGSDFVEIEKNEDVKKIPITSEALEQIKVIRSDIAKRMGRRPELDIIASAMINLATKSHRSHEEIEEYVKNFYINFYSKNNESNESN